MKFESKSRFVDLAQDEWNRLWVAADEAAQRIQDEPAAQIADDGIEWTLPDILAHLFAWHSLLLGWHKQGLAGLTPAMPAAGYNWRQTRELNLALYREHAGSTLAAVRRKLKRSHTRVMSLVDGLSEEELLETGHFAWTGDHSICSYIAPNTVSHYRWAVKKISRL